MSAQDVPMKRLIVCCDGTWQSSNHGLHTTPSNIAKISRSIAKYAKLPNGDVIHQIVFYHAGVGTSTETDKSLFGTQDKERDGAFGIGLDENVCESYNFLVNNYNPSDEIYMFGFSRGAYTARALAGLVCSVGLCTNRQMSDFWEMYGAYKQKLPETSIKETPWGKTKGAAFIKGLTRHISLKVVGVFDTVGSLGFPTNNKIDLSKLNRAYGFHDTNLHPQIEYAFHALAIDEHRAPFGPTLWTLPESVEGKPHTTKLIQCWFPGVHINIGGGSDDTLHAKNGDLEAMANITYAWMVDRVQENTSLVFDADAIEDVARSYMDAIIELAEKGNGAYGGWGVGHIIDSYNWKMMLAGSIPRTPGNYPEKGETHEYMHPVVAWALNKAFRDAHAGTPVEYKSLALEGYERVEAKGMPTIYADGLPSRYVWNKHVAPQKPGALAYFKSFFMDTSDPEKKTEVSIPEFVIPPKETAKFQSLERRLMEADLLVHAHYSALPGALETVKQLLQASGERTKQFIASLDSES